MSVYTRAADAVGPVDVAAAVTLAHEVLAGPRLAHVRAAAAAARHAARTVRAQDAPLLVAAAWLHDIGYGVARTGFHPLDGAWHLRDAGWPPRLVALVAHHSYAVLSAPGPAVADHLAGFHREEGPVTDALVYADMVSAPDGGRWPAVARLREMSARHAAAAPATRLPASARRRREVLLHEAVRRVQLRLGVVGLADSA